MRRGRAEVRVWDLPTRLFHWSFVLLIADAWASQKFSDTVGDNLQKWHRWNGYAILIAIVFRLIWGFAGSSTSRLSSFIRWPNAAINYGLLLLKGRSKPYLGHNPLGTWMIIGLVLAIIAQVMLGLFMLDHNDFVAGPLQGRISDETAKWLGHLHVQFFNFILLLIALHIGANLFYGFIKKEPLIEAMVTGSKPAEDYADEQEAVIVPRAGLRALICLIVAAAAVLGGIRIAGGVL
jgi:cytochrome b